MVTVLTDAAFAERMLRAALGGEPVLSEERIADLLTLATSYDADLFPQFTVQDLNRAASRGWQDKAALTADQYDIGGGAGKTLDRSQWFDHCMAMAAGYALDTYSVLGVTGGSKRGIGTIGFVSPLTYDEVL